MNSTNNIEFRKNLLDSIKKFEDKTGVKKSILFDLNYKPDKYKFDEKARFIYYQSK